jgi:hypothetical protein
MRNETIAAQEQDSNPAGAPSGLNDGLGSDCLTNALIAAGNEMQETFNWNFEEGGMGEFVTTIKKHIEPMINIEAYKRQRVLALRAEADAIERDA